MTSIDRILNWRVFAVVGVLWFLAHFGTDGIAALEGEFFPVVTPAEAFHVEREKDGVRFYVRFEKERACSFVGLSWYNATGELLALDFEPRIASAPFSRPPGVQYVGPWFLHGVARLAGTKAVASHDCGSGWATRRVISRFYPPPSGEAINQ